MNQIIELVRRDFGLVAAIVTLFLISFLVLRSIAPQVFPVYFVYLVLGVLTFLFFSKLDFEILKSFSIHLYFLCIIFLALPLIVGEVTRGAIRWIPIGALTIQPAEIVRPFLLTYFAVFVTQKELTLKILLKSLIIVFLPLFLILIQPSLGVAALTFIGFVGIFLSLKFNKKLLIFALLLMVILTPLFWMIMQPYQRTRITTLFSPENDPMGIGYNSIQSMISVGSGRIFGRGLGQGVQTQLLFLPERHTDFIFASVAEELGLAGSLFVIIAIFYLLYRVQASIEKTKTFTSRALVAGIFLTLFAQVVVHIGMNMGLFPITGLPLPLVSAGGSSMIGTMIMLGIVMGVSRQ